MWEIVPTGRRRPRGATPPRYDFREPDGRAKAERANLPFGQSTAETANVLIWLESTVAKCATNCRSVTTHGGLSNRVRRSAASNSATRLGGRAGGSFLFRAGLGGLALHNLSAGPGFSPFGIRLKRRRPSLRLAFVLRQLISRRCWSLNLVTWSVTKSVAGRRSCSVSMSRSVGFWRVLAVLGPDFAGCSDPPVGSGVGCAVGTLPLVTWSLGPVTKSVAGRPGSVTMFASCWHHLVASRSRRWAARALVPREVSSSSACATSFVANAVASVVRGRQPT